MSSLNIELRCLRDESVLSCVVIVVNRARSSLGGGETVLFSRIIMFLMSSIVFPSSAL